MPHQDRLQVSRLTDGVGLIVRCESGRSFPRHYHDEYGLGLMVAGAQRSASGRGQVEAVCGDVISVNPGEVHDGHPIGDRRRWWMIYLDPSAVEALWRGCEGEGDCEFQDPVKSDSRFASLLTALFRQALEPGCERAGIEELLLMLVARMGGPRGPRSPGRQQAQLAEAQALIDADPARAVTLRELADASGLSRFQILRGFVRRTGLTPHAYHVQQRLHLARELLRRGEAAAQAAGAAGFADQSHLNRCFVRAYGYTPGAYARAFR